MDTLPTESTWWDWLVRGLGGIVGIAESLLANGPRIGAEHHATFNDLVDRLDQVADKLARRRIDLGAESHSNGPAQTDRPAKSADKPIDD